MDKSPLISVVVICYNQEQTIGRALDSILNQKTTYSFEIIIGEDASPNDNTRAVCEEYVRKYPEKIRILPKASNKGLIRNYYDCLSECKGEFIATCTGDDWWHNADKLELQIEFLKANPSFGVVHTEADIYDPVLRKTFHPSRPRNCPEGDVLEKMFRLNFIYAISVVFRKELLKYANFEDWLKLNFVAEDHAMWLAFAPHTLFHYLPVSTITYSSSLESASRSTSLSKRLEFIKGICRIQSYFYEVQRPLSPSYAELTTFQKKWLIHEILVKRGYSKLSEYKAPLIIRLAPFPYYVFSRVIYKIKAGMILLSKGKTSIEFM